MQCYADRIILRGEKDLELVQSLQVSALWHYLPDHYDEFRFYQLVHLATIMSLDLALGQRYQPYISSLPLLGILTSSPKDENILSSEVLAERQRAWLGSYLLCGM